MAATPYWIEAPWPGRLAIVARPRGNEWLADEVDDWRQVGLDVIVSLLTRSEAIELDLEHERAQVEQQGLHFFNYPIPDRSTPPSMRETRKFVEQLLAFLAAGKNVGIHCRQGIGRSALITASLLVLAGLAPDEAFQHIQSARGLPVPETTAQRDWVARFAVPEKMPVLNW